jgi:ABC-type branched-subunit amino acid transport system ATPase component
MCLPAVAEEEIEIRQKVDELVALLGLETFRNKFIGKLPTGNRRIVDLAMTIAHRPSVLILDEPSSGIGQPKTEALGPLRELTGASGPDRSARASHRI